MKPKRGVLLALCVVAIVGSAVRITMAVADDLEVKRNGVAPLNVKTAPVNPAKANVLDDEVYRRSVICTITHGDVWPTFQGGGPYEIQGSDIERTWHVVIDSRGESHGIYRDEDAAHRDINGQSVRAVQGFELFRYYYKDYPYHCDYVPSR